MRMNPLEKLLVNRRSKGMSNVAVVRRQMEALDGPDGGHALELGSGAGDVAAYLARERGYDVIGTDVDPAQVELARSRHGEDDRLRFVVADAAELRLGDASVDLAVAQNVFHHLPRWRLTVRELARVLRPGGVLLWLDLTPTPLLGFLLRPLSGRFGVYTLDNVRGAFREAGFEEVAVRRPIRWLPLRHELVLRRVQDRPFSASR